jgi:FkbM family methyltransferase
MIKARIKKTMATTAQNFLKYCVKRGCMSQDDVIEKLSPSVMVNTKFGEIQFFCPGDLPLWRSKTFFEKEPETIEWINGFEADALFFDVGANIGLYSIYAGKLGHRVHAIEPMAENYFILQRNITINNFSNVVAYCACLYDQNKIDSLKIRNSGLGQAENSFDEPMGTFGELYVPQIIQGSIGITLDYFSAQIGVPAYLKIDIDGHEIKVLRGGEQTLANPKLKEILIELNDELDNYIETKQILEKHGFSLTEKRNAEMFESTKYKNVKNHIFKR